MSLSRREMLKLIATGTLAWILRGDVPITRSMSNEKDWPTKKEDILNRVKEVQFVSGSYVSTTLFLRKMWWEVNQVKKIKGEETHGDESDWLGNIEEMGSMVSRLSSAGVKSARLVVVPFEVTEDGENYNWEPMDEAIGLLQSHGIETRLAVGPIDFPHHPGIRLPKKIAALLDEELRKNNIRDGEIGMSADPKLPVSSLAIRDFCFEYQRQLLRRYEKDRRIIEFCWGNEWPDRHGIEGVEGGLTMSAELTRELVDDLSMVSDKTILLNTNIHPSETQKMRQVFGPVLNNVSGKTRLGLDTYPSQEEKSLRLNLANKNYERLVDSVREILPNTEICFEEAEAQPWPPRGIEGKSWAEIISLHNEDVFMPFYTQQFPPTLESHIAAAKVKQNGLWGAEAWIVADMMGDSFPLELVGTIANTMDKA